MKNLFRLLNYARPYWKYLIASVIAMIALTLCQLYAPAAVRELVALVTNQDPELGQKSLRLALILFSVYLLQAFCQFIRSYFTHYAAWKFVSDMRVRIYNHLQKLSLRYYHDKQTGQLMSRTSNDPSNLEVLIAHAVPDLFVNILTLAGVSIIIFSINPLLALICLITVPALVFLSVRFAKRVQPNFKEAQQKLAEFNAVLHDNLSGIKEIQIFNQQERESSQIKTRSQAHADILIHSLKLSAMYHPSIQFLNSMGTVLVIGFGGYLASNGRVPLEDLVAFILYLNMFYQPITAMARINEDMQNAFASADRIFEVLNTESDVQEKKNPIQLGRVQGDISIENVSFHYREGQEVLRNINLHIKPGEMVALVGPTGVGKTTLISLIARFYDPNSGCIRIDGTDIRDVSLHSLRENISMVLQDVFLFNGTVAENIAYGASNATMEQIIEAAKIAHAHEFIEKLEQGYDTVIGERGIKLSGGQKQRLSIARAVLRNSPILILDEATASVDVETEKLIHKAIDRVVKNRTTILIAHRLSTVKNADKIVVLNEGRIEEIGTHEELIAKNGLYSHLCKIQFREDASIPA